MIDRNKLLKAMGILALLFAVVGTASFIHNKNSMTLDEYSQKNPEALEPVEKKETANSTDQTDNITNQNVPVCSGDVSGNSIADSNILNSNGTAAQPSTDRVYLQNESNVIEESFFYEPLSEELIAHITGSSYPAESSEALAIQYEDLRYLHISHYDFNGEVVDGELICNKTIVEDLISIFYELYRNEYRLERVHLIDDYLGDDTASMQDNNTSCFNYRTVEGSTSLSKHALGLAVDINPLYNPYITYENGVASVSPAESAEYADRSQAFPYKIDREDLCYKLFTSHGFTWGGNWNSVKDYQHFQKSN